MTKIINVAELCGKNWNFIEEYVKNPGFEWKYFTGSPSNFLEKLIRRPKLSRYRAALQTCLESKNSDDVIISHLPRMSHWQSIFLNTFSQKRKHIAFAFNFTTLPGPMLQAAMIKSFRRIDKFIVFSKYEKEKYSDFFKIPIEKIEMLNWAMDTPIISSNYKPPYSKYYCSVGGEGRDYLTLIEAFRSLKQLKLHIVTRPNTLQGINIPDNVKVSYNLPIQEFWSIVHSSSGVIIPLNNEETACGHITLVGAMLLGKPIITTFSFGTTDYAIDGVTARVVPAKDTPNLCKAIIELDHNIDFASHLGLGALEFAQKNCHPSLWADFIVKLVQNSSASTKL